MNNRPEPPRYWGYPLSIAFILLFGLGKLCAIQDELQEINRNLERIVQIETSTKNSKR